MINKDQLQNKEEIPMIDIKIDGKAISIPKTRPHSVTGKQEPTTIIQACFIAGVDIPHFCYHPRLPVSGNCRMCLIEYGIPAIDRDRKPILNPDGTPVIRKMPRPAIACATPISPGMEIYTNTEAVKQYRQAVLEFLLINHPLDCPICDQAGDCKLQEYVHQYGQETSRFVEDKVIKPKKRAISSKIILDNERCVLCTRCVRFTREIIGIPALGILNRGGLNQISNYPGSDFEHNYTLNAVDLCPVGALTSRDFRFRMRSWFLSETKSICPGCATGCNIIIHSRDKQIYRLKPRENDNVNSVWMCDYGRLNYKWVNAQNRLTHVFAENTDGTQVESDWLSTLKKIISVLEKTPPKTTAILVSSRLSTEEIYLISKLAKRLDAFTDSISHLGEGDSFLLNKDLTPNSKAIQIFKLASKTPGDRIAEISKNIDEGKIRNLLVFGEDPIKSGIAPGILGRLDLFVICDILVNPSSKEAQYLLPGASFAEKQGTFINAQGRVQRFGKAFSPIGDARPEYWILANILTKITQESWPLTPEGIFNKITATTPGFENMTWELLGTVGMDIVSTANTTE